MYSVMYVKETVSDLKKQKRKGMYFIGLDEVAKTNQKSKK